jgi:flagellar biosynthesis/type III secretory pathway protein FliH
MNMSFNPEIDEVFTKVIEKLQAGNVSISNEQQNFIKKALQQSYDAGYEEGLTDGREIKERPISG